MTFWRQFIKLVTWRHFWGKNECFRNLKSRVCKINRQRKLQNLWRNCEFCTPSCSINRGVLHSNERLYFELLSNPIGLFTSTSGILNSCTWLLLFEVLRESSEILFLWLVSCEISWTTLSVDSINVNYSSWKCLYVPEISSVNKYSII